MFSPLNDPHVTDWFRRLDTAWKRMPAEEQSKQREEVRQHLEGLIAANVAQGLTLDAAWNAALVQFGDPAQIGRKLYQEWQQGRTGFRAEMTAIFYALELQMLTRLLWALSGLATIIGISPTIVCLVLYLACIPLACFLVGRKYPMLAIKGMFYTSLLCNLWLGTTYHHSPMFLVQVFLVIGFQVLVAYFASVTRRGWYRPTLNDFKLTLPKRRRQAGQ